MKNDTYEDVNAQNGQINHEPNVTRIKIVPDDLTSAGLGLSEGTTVQPLKPIIKGI